MKKFVDEQVYVQVFYDTNYVDGDGNRTEILIFDKDVSDAVIDATVDERAMAFFEDHTYLAMGYSYSDGFDTEQDEEDYFDSCYSEWRKITADEAFDITNDDPDIEYIHCETKPW